MKTYINLHVRVRRGREMSGDDTIRWRTPTFDEREGYPPWLRAAMKRDPSFRLAYEIKQGAKKEQQNSAEFDEATRAMERVLLLAEQDRCMLAMEGRAWDVLTDPAQQWRNGREPAELGGLEQQHMSFALALRLMVHYKQWIKIPGLGADDKRCAQAFLRASKYVAGRAEAERAEAHAGGMRWMHVPLPRHFAHLDACYQDGLFLLPQN